MTAPVSPAILAENLTIRERGEIVCANVSFSVLPGSIHVLLGRGAGPPALLGCLLGRGRPERGRARILGLDPARRFRLRKRRVAVAEGEEPRAALSRRPPPEVLLIDRPEADAIEACQLALRGLAAAGTATLVATGDAAVAGLIGDRIAIFARSRVVAEGSGADLLARFRLLRYANRATETRTAFGTELDDFDAVRVRVRGWGIEAVVSNFSEASFDRFRAADGVEDAAAESMTLSEIVEACSGE